MSGPFQRIQTLRRKFKDRKYRETYVAQHLRTFLANQIRALRGTLSQVEFGRLLGKPQSVVSRLESSDYGKLTLQTLLDIAAKMDVALLARFVTHDEFLRMTEDFSEGAYRPSSYENSVAKGFSRNCDKVSFETSNVILTTPHGPLKRPEWMPVSFINESHAERYNQIHLQ